jgi:hypothetical protein
VKPCLAIDWTLPPPPRLWLAKGAQDATKAKSSAKVGVCLNIKDSFHWANAQIWPLPQKSMQIDAAARLLKILSV